MSITISFIGAGNMGQALIRGMAGMKDVTLAAFDVDRAKLDALSAECPLTVAHSVHQAAAMGDYVVLCVKPQQMKALHDELHPAMTPDKCLVSIAAGITSQGLAELVGQVCPVVRVMPNTPALVGQGVMAICLDDPKLSAGQKETVLDMFASVGQVHELAEKDFDAFTGVVGSGPAYVYYFMEAMVEAAVASGLARPQATKMVTALFSGSVKLAEESHAHLSVLREMVTSPAGTTIAALMHLDRMAVRGSIVDAVGKSVSRSKELGG